MGFKKILFVIISIIAAGCTNNISSVNNSDSSDDLNASSAKPNVLFIIADDVGVAEIPGYNVGATKPVMPNVQSLVSDGVSFDSVWAYPICSPTRASILTGKESYRTGVTDATVNNELNENENTIFKHLKAINSDYEAAVFGKWHVSSNDVDGPSKLGVDDYQGLLIGGVNDYYNWNLTQNGSTSSYSGYITEKISDMAIDWISDKGEDPWFAWVAYTAPHTPFHLPPAGTHSQGDLSTSQADIDANPLPYFMAMLENLDHEIGRVLNSLSDEVRKNTVIVFLGDNGTHKHVIQAPYPSAYSSKGTLYQGGVHVPLIVSGANVSRKNARDNTMISSVDLHSTLLEIMGTGASNEVDAISFKDLLTSSSLSNKRDYSVSGFTDTNQSKSGAAIRGEKYKYMAFNNSTEAFVDLGSDPYELSPLDIGALSSEQQASYDSLKNKLTELYSFGTAKNITNSILTNTSSHCEAHMGSYGSVIDDILEGTSLAGQLIISSNASECSFITNSLPNHDINNGSKKFVNQTKEVSKVFNITKSPVFASSATPISINTDNAILLNGAKVDLLAAACYGVGPDPLGSEKIGCGDISLPWRYDPMSSLNSFGTDSHNAHTQGDGSYHYHGNPVALFDDSSSATKESPVIGFAADGFPIFGSYIKENGKVRRVTSGYTLKAGNRVSQPNEGAFPGGAYDGTFRDDYEFTNAGDLDECNGMSLNGVYGYYVTNHFPWIMSCFKGTPDSSFNK